MRFVLVHGGFHGAWCWERVVPELQALGHEAIAIDLPGHGARVDEEVTLKTRQQALVDVIEAGDVLVGHSGGGYDITLAADAVPERIGHLIYLGTGLLIEGKPLIEASGGRPAEDVAQDGRTQLMTDDTGMMEFIATDSRGNMVCADFEKTWAFFYHDCDEQTARRAFERLTPAPVGFIQEPVHLSRFWHADLPRSYIRCLQDRAAPAWLSAQAAERLGVEPLTIDASHSPFLSRPRETAELFEQAVATLPTGPLQPR
ncbi:alpha/beta fold hydrolase [Novosphingobium malaysiense]|uniref:Esterase n=1 Tax=Novosphingobium malaysiense TaxID=1348853 RepID=A0A0B1ZNC2_9SPHN|nr:alpha/beta fold hydrolase [Novosphingobium malaysiense]KHK92615.1 esterase [Novosphingobium malaysiense]